MSEVTVRDSEPQQSPEASEAAEQSPGASEAAETQPALELDCRGMHCPLPILRTKKAIDTLESGQVLRMNATDPGSIPDVAAFANHTGHAVLEQSEGGGEYSFLIRKR